VGLIRVPRSPLARITDVIHEGEEMLHNLKWEPNSDAGSMRSVGIDDIVHLKLLASFAYLVKIRVTRVDSQEIEGVAEAIFDWHGLGQISQSDVLALVGKSLTFRRNFVHLVVTKRLIDDLDKSSSPLRGVPLDAAVLGHVPDALAACIEAERGSFPWPFERRGLKIWVHDVAAGGFDIDLADSNGKVHYFHSTSIAPIQRWLESLLK